jgi:hypothetical protein
MIFKANRGGALQIGGEAWNLPALSFLSCWAAQSSCVLLCGGQSSPDALLVALLPPQQSNLSRHRICGNTWLAGSTHVYVEMNFPSEAAGEENE